MNHLRLVPLVAVAVAMLTTPTIAQFPDSITTDRADLLSGLYRDDDGHHFHFLNLRDQLGGRSVLSMTEYPTGRVRALWPDGSGGFTIGSGWFEATPVEATIRFSENGETVTVAEGERIRRLSRVRLKEREIRFESDGATQAGILVLPEGTGPHPALMMIQGSGRLTRRTPRQFGDLVAAHGVAVLVLDKRGTGNSEGVWSGIYAHDQWRSDVDRALDLLKQQPEIDSMRVGIYAASEGGFIGPALAASRGDIDFLVCRVCAALTHGETVQDMHERILIAAGRDSAVAREAREWLRLRQRYAISRTGYDTLQRFEAATSDAVWRDDFPPGQRTLPGRTARYWDLHASVLRGDPIEPYRTAQIPTLVVLGGNDQRIFAERHEPVLRSAGDHVEVVVVPGASHGLLLDVGTGRDRYPRDLHRMMVDWIVAQAGVVR